jgi:hypothetical protein
MMQSNRLGAPMTFRAEAITTTAFDPLNCAVDVGRALARSRTSQTEMAAYAMTVIE